ncbi:hypothetical protein [Microbacterium phyllosphaerae]|uniref:hypothetical protein n=1 Tax=Microbacterium phyllosphaerae TaxID=124798 RepID=UPI0011AE4B12|nr:hypothetical protein [Microbacterium phyllosphaerae]
MNLAEVDALVEQCVSLASRTVYSEAEIRFATRPFLTWAVNVAGVEADLFELFSTSNIERFIVVAREAYSPGSLGNLRSRLFRVAEQIGDLQGRRPPVAALPPSSPVSPYAPREVAEMMSWAVSLSTESRRASAVNLLALGLGAGLSSSEIGNLRVKNVSEHPRGGIDVRVEGARERTVTMKDVWASELRLPAELSSYVFRPDRDTTWRTVVNNFVQRAPGTVLVQTQRLRATWIVGHLAAGTHASTLVKAAGVDSLEALTRYLQFVPSLAEDAARTELRLGH